MTQPTPMCDVCGKTKEDGVNIFSCGGCKSRVFCGSSCQRADWQSHKASCNPKPEKKWYDAHRKCMDGSSHFGELELITWDGIAPHTGEQTAWGHILFEESAELKQKYEETFECDDSKMFKEWPQGYRWTCCGNTGIGYRCEHHGTGPRPCSCEDCITGKPIADEPFNDAIAQRHGLTLSRGPDERSYDPKISPFELLERGFAEARYMLCGRLQGGNDMPSGNEDSASSSWETLLSM